MGGVPQLGNGLMPPRAAGMGGNTLAVQTAMNQLDSCGKAYSNLSSPTEPLPFSFDRIIQGRVIKDTEVPSTQTDTQGDESGTEEETGTRWPVLCPVLAVARKDCIRSLVVGTECPSLLYLFYGSAD
ncbi:hypothetical protein U9M48_020904 [Paspalum notatum var. saurae]|uniref:Uncharacterized protein n=1 Tax=Paspalum notatum var. saurae TaxID=547442 RepID=A0AAQ3TH95_PASNO